MCMMISVVTQEILGGGDICNHIHDENCGYVEAVQGSPCNYQCEICGKEEDVEETEETKEITILSFETLPEEVKKQKADVGTAQQDLNLPETLKAVTSEKEEAEDIPVTWSASPEYDGEKDGTYRFTPQPIEGYVLSTDIVLPEIVVQVGTENTAKSSGHVTLTYSKDKPFTLDMS